MNNAEKIIASRTALCNQVPKLEQNCEEEGGCGVTGFISSIPVTGKNIFEPSAQMHNRGNGKGGGIAAMGFIPESLCVSQEINPLGSCLITNSTASVLLKKVNTKPASGT